ncbi:MAG TPA: DUF4861 family protein, partial [Ohtaekwangia sp.]|uniref:DUF4861 family protein n=1 Tax=Ohtaekwangia sp. TaxID=2066019 RepID=UPI002F92405E
AASVQEFTEDEYSHVVKLRAEQGKLEYYFSGAWEGEPGGIKDEEQFLEYIQQVALELANPIKVTLSKSAK